MFFIGEKMIIFLLKIRFWYRVFSGLSIKNSKCKRRDVHPKVYCGKERNKEGKRKREIMNFFTSLSYKFTWYLRFCTQ